jgi:VWFA-related protein
MRIRYLVWCVALVAFAAAVYPQEQNPAGRQQDKVVVDVVQVPLLVSVADNRGRLITTLKKEDFRIYEDDRLQTIDTFASETNLPLSIALLIDSSGSVIDKLRFEQDAATDFFFNTLKRGKDRGIVIEFNSVARDLTDGFTDNLENLAEALKKIKAGGSTAIHDAVYLAVGSRLSKEDGDRRRLIVVISDGDDTASRYSQLEALEMAQKNDIAIYAISTNRTSDLKRSDQVRGDDILKRMVEETGGKVYFPLKLEDLTEEFEKIGDELRSQYVIYYTPTNGVMDGTYRRIRVEMSNNRYKATTRRGYYATKSNTSN